jgi:hypothetical protein
MEDIVEEILQDTIESDTHSAEARHARKQRADRMTMDYGWYLISPSRGKNGALTSTFRVY